MPRKVLNDELLREIKELRDRGYGYKRIRKYLKEKYGIEVSNSTLHYLVRVKLGDENVAISEIPWEPRRCPELAYIIGVALGDASLIITKRIDWPESKRYFFKLKVRDKEFAEEVKKVIERLGLPCSEVKEYYDRRDEAVYYSVYCYVKRFVLFLRDLKDHPEKVWEWIKGYEEEFLRGFYESEGCLHKSGKILIYNTRREYIDIVTECLQRLRIKYNILFKDQGAYKGVWIVYIPVHEVPRFLAITKPAIKYSRDDPHYQRIKKEREERQRRRLKNPQRPPQALVIVNLSPPL
ncbi:MAG: hypothetical protein DRN15_06850 [Thermoprotei archaeon]|nr:MAG: hypothetical protein DRN15_06850 [Thermoprotei archaeon]